MPRGKAKKTNDLEVDVVGRNIKRLMDKHGIDRQNELAKAAGIHSTNLSKMISGEYAWNKGNLKKLAKALGGESVSEFFADPAKDDGFDPRSEVRITVWDVAFSAGPGVNVQDYPEKRKELTFSREWINKMRLRPAALKIVSVSGNSMEPLLYSGDKIVINSDDKDVVDGHVYALTYGNQLRIKRLYRLADGRLKLSSDNKVMHDDEFVSPEQEEHISIEGRAVHRMGDGGL